MSQENERRASELSLSHQHPSHHDAAPLCELCGVLAGHSGICCGKLAQALDAAEARALERAAELCIERCQNKATGAVLAGLIRALKPPTPTTEED